MFSCPFWPSVCCVHAALALFYLLWPFPDHFESDHGKETLVLSYKILNRPRQMTVPFVDRLPEGGQHPGLGSPSNQPGGSKAADTSTGVSAAGQQVGRGAVQPLGSLIGSA